MNPNTQNAENYTGAVGGEFADATQDDHLIAETDNSSDLGVPMPNQDPNVPIVSDGGNEGAEVE